MLLYAFYTLAAVYLVSRFLTRSWIEQVEVRRECNRLSADVGDRIAVVVEYRNTGKLPITWALVEDVLARSALLFRPPNLEVTGNRLQLALLAPGAKRTLMYQLKCHRRGYYQLGPTVVETGDLFGLHRRYKVGASPDFLTVYPTIVPLEQYRIESRRPIGEVRMTHRLFEDPTRIAGVRRYQAGDPLNRVHWHATARTGTLHSKIYEPSTVMGATILLDFHRDAYPKGDRPVRPELAVTAAASLANYLSLQRQQVGFITNGQDAADRIRFQGWTGDFRTRSAAQQAAEGMTENDRLRPVIVPTSNRPDAMLQIREVLARTELGNGLTFPQLILETECRMPRDASVIAIVGRMTDETAIALGGLARQGFAVTVLVNMFDEYDFAKAAGYLVSQHVKVRHLQDENSLRSAM